ncbi:MAG: N-acetylglucosamine-6-phosphate deacetylase [Bacteroidetes bacterium]|nr:MAG: N-acetylglucosamine-6-phosphate deacetylase [Bacteroidota bacterium]
MQRTKIQHGKIISQKGIGHGTILIEGSKIVGVEHADIQAPDAKVIDAKGNFVSPGFIDLHVHGGNGFDFMDGTEQAYQEISILHARHGTTSIAPTTMSCSHNTLKGILSAFETFKNKQFSGSCFIGIHIEGPYFAFNQRGAHDGRYIRSPKADEYKEIISTSASVARWSAAPELPGALEFGNYLRSKKILPSLAHTDAIYEEIITAFKHGFTHATHLYSAMSGVTKKNGFRYAGAVESAFLIDEMTVEIIADGAHLPPPLLQLVYKIKGPEKIALITDAMRGAGLAAGPSVLGSREDGLPVIIEDGVAKLPDRSAFAGSVATADRLIRNMIQMAGAPLVDAVRMMTTTPAEIMNLSDKKGTIEVGKDADIVIFDDDLQVKMTMVQGKIVYEEQ